MTGIVIPVREAEQLVRSRVLKLPQELREVEGRVGSHITLLAPFHRAADVDDVVLDDLAAFFADLTPFGFDLVDVCEFPGGVSYLAPEPASTFRLLTTELHRRFPEFPPYGGEFDDIVPHLTLPVEPAGSSTDLGALLGPMLPIHAHAVEALLVHVEEEDTHVIATFPFGTTAA
ncbi:MAG: 2-5 ligase family protein [Marmoricola sp.]|nr:2-5 ligase family protein [Marmoricola sp.]